MNLIFAYLEILVQISSEDRSKHVVRDSTFFSLCLSLSLSSRLFILSNGFSSDIIFPAAKVCRSICEIVLYGCRKKKGMKGKTRGEDTSCDSKRDFAASGIFVGKNVTSGKKRIDKRR